MGNLEIATLKAFARIVDLWAPSLKNTGRKRDVTEPCGEAYQHLCWNPGRQVVEEQDKDECLLVTGSGSADIFHDI